MKTILVGYDETEPARRALERAAELATAFDAKVIVTSVAQALVGAVAARGVGPYDPVDSPELHREELRHAAEFLGERGVQAEYTVALGDPATVILDLAEERHADLIVVGTREAGLLERLLDSSVSGAVQRKAHCDVLVVH
jgi:nucleotide-binding universal stress UspA family protein